MASTNIRCLLNSQAGTTHFARSQVSTDQLSCSSKRLFCLQAILQKLPNIFLHYLSFALADNIDLGLNNSCYHAQPYPLVVK